MNLSTRHRTEVDLRVAQELKNNQDFIYQTGQSIQNLRNGLTALEQERVNIVAKSHSDRTAISIEFENLRETVLLFMKDMNQRIGDVETKICNLSKSIDSINKEVNAINHDKEKYNILFDFYKDCIFKLNYEIKKLHTLLESSLCNLRENLKSQLNEVKQELTPKIPEVDPIKKYIDDTIKVFRVDFEGLIREITLLKRSSAYDQKKFENIYTLIDRLKAGKNA